MYKFCTKYYIRCAKVANNPQLCVQIVRMILRKIFPELEEHLQQKQITVITGMRRVGKSTALKFLLGKVPHENKVYLDLERVENRFTFQQMTYRDIQIDLEIAGIDFTKPAVIGLDEIQLVPQITSALKWFYDTYPNLKFIVTGSSSFYLKNRFSESLAGRKHIFEMFPLDFMEFIQFKGEEGSVLNRFQMQPFQQSLYFRFKNLYEEYLRLGGFPEVVLMEGEKEKQRMLKDVINAYIDLDIRLVADFEVSGTLYKLIRLLAARTGTELDVSKVCALLGMDRRKTASYIDLLQKTYFIHLVAPFARSVDKEIAHRNKVYFADTGLLNTLAQVSSGQVFENAIYLQLMKRGQKVNYYRRRSGQEIDFVVDQTTAFEVKETPHLGDKSMLIGRAASAGFTENAVIGKTPPGDEWRDFIWGACVF